VKKSVKSRDLMYPDRLVSNMITDYIEGSFNGPGFLSRAIVVEIDMEGGRLSGPNTNVPSNFPNPRNSIKARIIGKDRYKSTDNLGVFWPMFPHDVMPLIEGEHVYVLFENPEEETSGIWICRIPEPQDVDTANFVDGNEKYKDSNNAVGIDQTVADMDTAPDPINRPPEFVVEKVPDFKPRKGDRVIKGSNNTIIILGRD